MLTRHAMHQHGITAVQALVNDRPCSPKLVIHALAPHLNLHDTCLWQCHTAPTLGVLWQAGDLKMGLGIVLHCLCDGNAR